MANKNTNLHSAKSAKNDEFYTQLTDIEKEMMYYKDFFKGKVVLCNCNDMVHTNFAKYFSLNFEHLGLKKLICTAYKIDGVHGKVCIYEGDKNGNLVPDIEEWEQHLLNGDGSFDSEECIEFLKECDVVVTNPPFSLFRSFVKTLFDYNKKFLIIGNMNAITYKEIFPYIKNNQMWLGVSSFNKGMYFIVDDDFEYGNTYKFDRERNGVKVSRVASIVWFTNIDNKKRNTPLDLYKRYNEKEFPKYDNYNAIEVSKVCDIPMDYDGVMGVPITFLDKYCPTQFEIIGIAKDGSGHKWDLFKPSLEGKEKYARILIKKRDNQ